MLYFIFRDFFELPLFKLMIIVGSFIFISSLTKRFLSIELEDKYKETARIAGAIIAIVGIIGFWGFEDKDVLNITNDNHNHIITQYEWEQFETDSIRINLNNLNCKDKFNIFLSNLRAYNKAYELDPSPVYKDAIISQKQELLNTVNSCEQ